MATYHDESATFVGPPDQIKRLKKLLNIYAPEEEIYMELRVEGVELEGLVQDYEESDVRISLTSRMQWSPLSNCFKHISEEVPGLLMTSSSECDRENLRVLVGGYGRYATFDARPPMYDIYDEPLAGFSTEDRTILDLVSGSFADACLAAEVSFERGFREPRKAIAILRDTVRIYNVCMTSEGIPIAARSRTTRQAWCTSLISVPG